MKIRKYYEYLSEEVLDIMGDNPLDALVAAKKVIGAKQVARAIDKGLAVKIYLANDADKHVIMPLRELCKNKQIEVDNNFSMAELGKACRIEVGTAAAAIVKNC